MRPSTIAVTARLYWCLAGSFAALALLFLVPGSPAVTLYRAAVTSAAAVAACCMAAGDARTGRLRNAWTGPYAAGAAIQVLVTVVLVPHGVEHAAASFIGVILSGGFYLAMGLRGWVGFGDVKFVVGLALIAGVVSGWTALLLAPIAVLVSGIVRFVSLFVASGRLQLPHGPALAVALITTAAIGYPVGR